MSYQYCPKCGQKNLPSIPPDSQATATRCQHCGATVTRAEAIAELDRLQAIEDARKKAVKEIK